MSALVLSPGESDLRRIIAAINQLTQGRSNAVGSVTLTTSTTTTTVAAQTCGSGSTVILSPTTANAAGALATTYISSVGNSTFTITHASNAQTDRTFLYVAIG